MHKRIHIWISEFEQQTTVQYVLLALILAVGAAMRLYMLGTWSFWIDEVETLIRVQRGYAGDVNLMQPISTRLIGMALATLGTNEWNARIVPALFGTVSGAILFFPIKRLFGPTVALLAVLLLVLSPWHLYWSQNARFYTALLLFYTLAILTLLIGIEEQRPWLIGVALIFLGLATLERMLALLCIPVAFGFLTLRLFFSGRLPRIQTRWILLLLCAPLLFIVVDILYGVLLGGDSLFLFQSQVFLEKFVGNVNLNPVRLLLAFVYRLGLPLATIATFAGIYLVFADRQHTYLFLVSSAIVPVILLLFLSFFTTTQDRYLFMILPSWIILGALAVRRLFMQTSGIGKVLAIALACLLAGDYLSQDILYYQYQNGFRMDWKGAFALVQQQRADGDLIVTSRPKVGNYYMGENVLDFAELAPESLQLDSQRIWFVLDNVSERSQRNPALQEFARNSTELVDVREVQMPGKVMTVRVYLYDPARFVSNDAFATLPHK